MDPIKQLGNLHFVTPIYKILFWGDYFLIATVEFNVIVSINNVISNIRCVVKTQHTACQLVNFARDKSTQRQF